MWGASGGLGSPEKAPDPAQVQESLPEQRTSKFTMPRQNYRYPGLNLCLSQYLPILPLSPPPPHEMAPLCKARTLKLSVLSASHLLSRSTKSCVSPTCSISRRDPESDHLSPPPVPLLSPKPRYCSSGSLQEPPHWSALATLHPLFTRSGWRDLVKI